MEGSSRIRGEVTDTETLIPGSSQEEMMMSSESQETSYLSSVTVCEGRMQPKSGSPPLRTTGKRARIRSSAGPCVGGLELARVGHVAPALQEHTYTATRTDNKPSM